MRSMVVLPMPRLGTLMTRFAAMSSARVHDEREVGHDVADLGAVEEARAADDAVRHASAQQHVFQHAALRVRAVEHGHLVVRQPRRALLLDLAGDPAAFIALVGGHVHLDLVAVLGAGEQLLRLAVLVVRDDRVRGRQNVAHAAVFCSSFTVCAVG